jgi:hypothetical protein
MTFDAAVRSSNGCTERISPHHIIGALAEAFSVILWPEEMLSAWLFRQEKPQEQSLNVIRIPKTLFKVVL